MPLEALIASLFANGEEGAWYDPSDLSTLYYQDAAGTTPVTALGQPVGLIIDKSRGLVRGPELVPALDLTAADWATTGTLLTVTPSSFTNASGSAAGRQTPALVTSGKTFQVSVSYTKTNSGVSFFVYASGGNSQASSSANSGTLSCIITATTNQLYLRLNGNDTVTITSLSVRELPGNHARQATATARPTLQAGNKIDFDGVDDKLTTTFPDLGSNVTIVRSVPGVGASILTGQTIGAGAWDDSTDHHGLIIINRALTAPETALVTRWANLRAGV